MATITNAGMDLIQNQLYGLTTTPVAYIALDCSSVPESQSVTTLGDELALYDGERAALEAGEVTINNTTHKVTVTHTFGPFTGVPEEGVAINGFGLLTAASNGTLYLRHLLTNPTYIYTGESLQVTIEDTPTRA